MTIIKNRAEIVEQLASLLMDFDKQNNTYQTDVYLYLNAENQTAELDTFVNVGGNSWLNDDHITIYTDKEHYNDIFDWYDSEAELAEFAEIPLEQLKNEVVQYLELDEEEAADYELTFSDAEYYLKTVDSYMENLSQAYDEAIDDLYPEYLNTAEEIMRNFEEEQLC